MRKRKLTLLRRLEENQAIDLSVFELCYILLWRIRLTNGLHFVSAKGLRQLINAFTTEFNRRKS